MNKESEALKQIAHMSDTAIRVFTDWSLRQRHRGPIDIVKNKRALRNAGEPINDDEYAMMLVELQKAGFGKVIKDHRGRTRYFELSHPIYRLGRAAIEGRSLSENTPIAGKTVAATRRATPTQPRAALVTHIPETHRGTNTVVYCVVGNKKVRLELEGEINQDALDQILKTLQNSYVSK